MLAEHAVIWLGGAGIFMGYALTIAAHCGWLG
jgi:hypothetical protein